ncbi:MAG: hypothetical protein EOO72_03440, partial [Myxococcaceae bacterium]
MTTCTNPAGSGTMMTEEDLAAARYAVSSGDSAEADWTAEWGARVFAHLDAQAAQFQEAHARLDEADVARAITEPDTRTLTLAERIGSLFARVRLAKASIEREVSALQARVVELAREGVEAHAELDSVDRLYDEVAEALDAAGVPAREDGAQQAERVKELVSERDALREQVEAVRLILPLLTALAAHPAVDENAVVLSMDCEEVEAPWRLTYSIARTIVAALSTPPAKVCPEPSTVQGNLKPSANSEFAGRIVRVLGEATAGTEHPHTVRLVLCQFPGGEEVPYLDASERGGPHTGGRILALSTVVHA